ncbi:hypothetical protein U5817_09960 [Aromatoleum evansii]|uniref:Uncharacterized protein n=1 Tax=Aromatoleum evansii TaxID=59406 RepID=A0ABZ1AUH6_AROEV|nr:hypothetical protein U5817_09610 [Aromatoleum evansii]WRL48351.1 hypothetical protein U5817_09960 [Aromatoleum evansii]
MKAKLIAVAADWCPDALMAAGAVAVSYGAWMVYAPAGWIIGGLFGIAAGVLGSRR